MLTVENDLWLTHARVYVTLATYLPNGRVVIGVFYAAKENLMLAVLLFQVSLTCTPQSI